MATMGGTKRARGGATALDVMQSSRKLRCVLLACAAMTQYLLAREEIAGRHADTDFSCPAGLDVSSGLLMTWF